MNREWTAKWIGPQEEDKFNPVIYKDFFVDEQVKKATLFIASIGLFEAYINGTRIGKEFLTPYKQDPEKGIQYFEFDITEELNCGADSDANSLDVFLGTDGEEEEKRFALKAEIVIEVQDAEEETEYLSMEFDETLVEPGKFSNKKQENSSLDELIDFEDAFEDDFEDEEFLNEIIKDKQSYESIAESNEPEEILHVAESAEEDDLDNLFNDDLFDAFVDEIIEEKKANPDQETNDENIEKEQILPEETEEEPVLEEPDFDFDLSSELISKAGFSEAAEETEAAEEFADEITEVPSEEIMEETAETIEETPEESEEVLEDLFDDELDEILEEAANEFDGEQEGTVEEISEEIVEEEAAEEVAEEAVEEEAAEEIVEEATEPEVADEAVEAAEVIAAETIVAEAVEETVEEEVAEEADVIESIPENAIIIATDETWGYYASDIEVCGVGKGEIFNRLLWAEQENPDKQVEVLDLDISLVERYAEPITVLEELKPEVIKNAAGEEILDFGQPFTGYVSFSSDLPEGRKVVLEFINDPDADSEPDQPSFTYVTDGVPEIVSAHFTYFNGRYVKVSGWNGPLNPAAFTAIVLLPETPEEPEEVIEEEPKMEEDTLHTGFIETSDENLNRLFDNIFERQENVFASVFSDEESDDAVERIDKFTAAACYNMDVKEEIEKLLSEQEGKCLVTVPWTLYNIYGDKEILEDHYEAMKAYIDDAAQDIDGFRDESDEFIPYDDASDGAFITSANFYEAADIMGKTAKILEKEDDAEKYSQLAENVKNALLDEFFTKSGRNFLSTQEEMVTALRTGIYINKERFIDELKEVFKADCYQITCGAEETPNLCKTLAENGLEDLAYRLLLEINNYGWLYSVEESDTTIWTSSDAIMEDGTVDKEILEEDDSMEYGAVAEFLYAYVLGIKPLEPGFKKIELAPLPNSNLIYANGEYQSPAGKIVSGWEVLEDGKVQFHFEIPEGAEARVILPACDDENIAVQELAAGAYDFEYMPTKDYIHLFNENSTIGDLLKYQESLDAIEEIAPELAEKIQNADLKTCAEPIGFIKNLGVEEEQLKEIEEIIFQLA